MKGLSVISGVEFQHLDESSEKAALEQHLEDLGGVGLTASQLSV